MYVPFTGLGLHNGFRGNTWLKNRIQIFKQFVVPSLHAQTSWNFILWFSWRREEKNNILVKEFITYLEMSFNLFDYGKPKIKIVHTFAGVCFYDDKYPDEVARDRLLNSIHLSMPDLLDAIGECDYVLMTIQPSDDLYHRTAVEGIQKHFEKDSTLEALGFSKGYICNYNTKEVAEYNPTTNPPFYTVKFSKEDFQDPFSHVSFTSLRYDVGKYKKGTPCPSHEYIGDCVNYAVVGDLRGFLVGTHGVNISTTFTNPYKGESVDPHVLERFGILDVPPLEIKVSLWKKVNDRLPYPIQRKIRYVLNEWKLLDFKSWPGLLK